MSVVEIGGHTDAHFGWIPDTDGGDDTTLEIENLIADEAEIGDLYYDNAYELTPGHRNVHHNEMLLKQNVEMETNLFVDNIQSFSYSHGDGVHFGSGAYMDDYLYVENIGELNYNNGTNFQNKIYMLDDMDVYGQLATNDITARVDGNPIVLDPLTSHVEIAAGKTLKVDRVTTNSGDLTIASNTIVENAITVPTVNTSTITEQGLGNGVDINGNTSIVGSADVSGNLTVGVAAFAKNLIPTTASSYATGTASQTSTIVNGVGTTWTSAMTGGVIIWSNGSYAAIRQVSNSVQMIVEPAQTVSSGSYTIYYGKAIFNDVQVNAPLLKVGTASQAVAKVGTFQIHGSASDQYGPHIEMFMGGNTRPTRTIWNYSSSDVRDFYNCYYNSGNIIASDADGSFSLGDESGVFACKAGRTSAGSTLTMSPAWSTTDTALMTIPKIADATSFIVNSTDNTKKLQLSCSGISTGTTRTLTVPNLSATIATYTGTPAVGDVLTSTGTDGSATWQSPTGARLKTTDFLEDFEGIGGSTIGVSTTDCYMIGDKPWYAYSAVLSEIAWDPLYTPSSSLNSGQMFGCLYGKFTTPAANTERGYAMSNSSMYQITNGNIRFDARLKIVTLSSPIANQKVFVGLGSVRWINIIPANMAPLIGFYYTSTGSANWQCVTCTSTGGSLSSFITATPVTTNVVNLRFDFTTAGNYTFYIDGVQVHSGSISTTAYAASLIGPRLMSAYTKDTNPIPSDGVGVIWDTISVRQAYDRGF